MQRGVTAEQVLDAAEHRIRRFGYNGFSFRDLANEVGVKSSSVHHHFATKPTLAAAVARRYTQRFFAALAEPQGVGKKEVAQFISLFRHSLFEDDQMCLCGMLAAEVSALPADVVTELRTFFDRALGWLGQALQNNGRPDEGRATTILTALEGALMLARAMQRPELFDRVADEILERVDNQPIKPARARVKKTIDLAPEKKKRRSQ